MSHLQWGPEMQIEKLGRNFLPSLGLSHLKSASSFDTVRWWSTRAFCDAVRVAHADEVNELLVITFIFSSPLPSRDGSLDHSHGRRIESSSIHAAMVC